MFFRQCFLWLFLMSATMSFCAEGISVDPSQSQIVVSVNADKIKRFAAEELQYHLQLISGVKIPIVNKADTGYIFYVGIPDPTDKKKLLTEEARWIITPQATYLWGEDKYESAPYGFPDGRKGSMFAVYDFLNNILNVHHIEPGVDGISFKKQKTLTLPVSNEKWRSSLEFRGIRVADNWQNYKKDLDAKTYPAFKMSREEFSKFRRDTALWCVRMRMGRRSIVPYGHSFTKWWDCYHKTHPEYFALNSSGKRAPVNNEPSWIKLCLSNPAVTDQIFQNWLLTYKKRPQLSKILNLCINDGGAYCECKKCKALGSISDRLAYLTNTIMGKAEKVDPEIRCTIYAYADYVAPPQKTKVNPRTIVGFVPIFLDLKTVEKNYRGWYKMGAKALFLRPNALFINVGLPMGYEKEIFKGFQLGMKYGVIGTDYDCLHNFWSANGIAPYILAKAFIDPSKSFDYWENEYCSAYGPAADIVKKYFQYIRSIIWEGRVMTDKGITNYAGVLRRNIAPHLKQLVKENDYIHAGNILKKAQTLKLAPQQAKRLNVLILENQHALLTVRAIQAGSTEKTQRIKELLAFRIKHKNDLNIYWPSLLAIEQRWDIVGLKGIDRFKEYSYVKETPSKWYFEVDNKASGSKEKWQNYDFERIKNTWTKVPIYCNWEKFGSQVPPPLTKMLVNYNGIGWYAQSIKIDKDLKGKKIYLYFEAVDESCWIYVNGKLAGKHLFMKPADWKTPFTIRIDRFINWKENGQLVTIKVEDKEGAGGIYKPVWVVAE